MRLLSGALALSKTVNLSNNTHIIETCYQETLALYLLQTSTLLKCMTVIYVVSKSRREVLFLASKLLYVCIALLA